MALAKPIGSKIVKETRTIGFLLYLFVIPPLISVLLALFSLQIKAFFFNFVAFVLFYLALHFSKKGFKAEFQYQSSNFAKAPKPYKLTGALFLSAATFYSAYILDDLGVIQALFLAIIAFIGYWFWYGFDPREDKIPQMDDIGAKVAFETIQKAKKSLEISKETMAKIKNDELRAKVQEALDAAYEILDELDKNPSFVRPLRKFLVVYVDSIQEVTQSYVEAQEEVGETQKKQLFDLMDRAQKRFEKELRRVRESNIDELDTKMKTFDRQLKDG